MPDRQMAALQKKGSQLQVLTVEEEIATRGSNRMVCSNPSQKPRRQSEREA